MWPLCSWSKYMDHLWTRWPPSLLFESVHVYHCGKPRSRPHYLVVLTAILILVKWVTGSQKKIQYYVVVSKAICQFTPWTLHRRELIIIIGSVVKILPAMQKTQVQSLGQEDSLEEDIATHSSILAWRIPWTEESSGLVHRVAKSQAWLKRLSMYSKLQPFLRRSGRKKIFLYYILSNGC